MEQTRAKEVGALIADLKAAQDEIHVLKTSELDELAQYRTKETKEQPK